MCFQINKPLSSAAEQQFHHRPALRASLSKTSQSSPFVFPPELICLLEHFQDNSLNVLHSTQICD